MLKKNKLSERSLLEVALLSQLIEPPPDHYGITLSTFLGMALISLMLLLTVSFLFSVLGS